MTTPVRGAVLRADAATVAAAAADLLAAAARGVPGLLAAVVDPPALVLGSAQRADGVDREACARAGLAVTRRGSGGGAVLCDAGLLEVDVALPPGHPLQEPDVAESYRPLGAAWAAALRSAGVACRLVDVQEARVDDPARRAVARQVCWAGLSPYEVLTPGGSKLVGLSQRRRGGAVLVQCGVLLRGDPARVLDLVRLGADERRAGRRALAGSPALDALAGPSWGDPELAWQRLAPAVTGALGLTSAGTAVTPVPSASS